MTTVRGILIPATGAPSVHDFPAEYDGQLLEGLQRAVGGWIEAVVVGGPDHAVIGEPHTIYLNEEGKLQGLPVNDVATRLTRGILPAWDMVVGDVVLVRTDEDGDTISVTDQAIAAIGSGEGA